jgi:HEAT repeat protein
LASATLSDHLLQLVVWVSIALLAVMLWLLMQIAWLRFNLIKRTAREQRFLEVWRPLLAAAIAGEKDTLPPLASGDEIFFLKLWNHLQESLRGKAKRQLNILALRCGVLQQAYALLDKDDLRSQLLALTTLGHLGDRSSWGDILRLALQPDPLLSLAAARALLQLDANMALHDLKQALLEREDWPTAQLAIMIQEAGSESVFATLLHMATELAGSTEPARLRGLNRVLHLLEVAPPQDVVPTVRSILAETENDEIIAQCLKYLHEPGDLPSVRIYTSHPNWIVRLQAAAALGRIGSAEDMARLVTLLGDSVWWVRYRTAHALVALTRGNLQRLAELSEHLDDRFARDMLAMAMEEKKGP